MTGSPTDIGPSRIDTESHAPETSATDHGRHAELFEAFMTAFVAEQRRHDGGNHGSLNGDSAFAMLGAFGPDTDRALAYVLYARAGWLHRAHHALDYARRHAELTGGSPDQLGWRAALVALAPDPRAEAERLYRMALSLNPRFAQVRYAIAALITEGTDAPEVLEEAIGLLEEAEELSAGLRPHARWLRGTLLSALGRIDAAIEALEGALDVALGAEQRVLASALRRRGDIAAAIGRYEAALPGHYRPPPEYAMPVFDFSGIGARYRRILTGRGDGSESTEDPFTLG